jgi:subtilisin family serine protease
MYKSVSLVLAASLAILFAASIGQGPGDHSAELLSDESITPLSDSRFDVKPTKCREVGKDCVAGEILAILENPRDPNVSTEFAASEMFRLLNSLTPSGPNPPFTFKSVKAFQLEEPAATSPEPYKVCGQFLLRIKFTPEKKVDEVMQFVWNKIHSINPASNPLINKSTVHGIQPVGFTRPSQPITSEPFRGPVADGTLRIGSQNLLTVGQRLPNVTVAILDTGWTSKIGSPSEKVNVLNTLSWDVSDIDNLPPKGLALDKFFDPSLQPIDSGLGHGTPIASIIGSSDPTIGVASNAQIVPIKICNDTGDCNEASAIYGTCYAMSSTVQASVINMSFAGRTMVPITAGLAGFHAPIFEGLINDAARARSLVVVAAGNSRDQSFIDAHPNQDVKNEPLYPGVLSSGYLPKLTGQISQPNIGMLSVGAAYSNLYYASFATYHAHVDITAPGSWVKAVGKDGEIKSSSSLNPANLVNVDGTSFATAYVSGAAAFLIGYRDLVAKPRMKPAELAQLIVKNANPTKSGCLQVQTDPMFYDQCGNGFLDVYKASR